jgi:hypothetical protein
MNRLILVSAAILCLGLNASAQTATKVPDQTIKTLPTAPAPPTTTPPAQDPEKLQMAQQIGNLQSQLILTTLELNEQQIKNLKDQLKPLEEFRTQVIERINSVNPGSHWDDVKHELVADPKTPKK